MERSDLVKRLLLVGRGRVVERAKRERERGAGA
jgi:hypothetical protein